VNPYIVEIACSSGEINSQINAIPLNVAREKIRNIFGERLCVKLFRRTSIEYHLLHHIHSTGSETRLFSVAQPTCIVRKVLAWLV
jgi:hypothetical protein